MKLIRMAVILMGAILLCSCTQVKAEGFMVNSIDADYGDKSSGRIPQVSGLENKAVMNRINNGIKLALTEKYDSVRDPSLGGKTTEAFDYDIAGALLIINHEGDYYVPGAAHGLPYRTYLHINLNDGAFYNVESAIRGMGSADKVRELLAKKLEHKLGPAWLSYGVPMKDAMYTLAGNNIRVVFPPYSVAAYSEGFVDIDLSFDELESHIDYDSPVMRAYLAR